MNVFIVYAHPSEDSFTRHVRDEFIMGLEAAGHSYVLSDLYKMGFQTDMSEAEYLREANFRLETPLPDDVIAEQDKINSCDAIVFIYPVFWTEAPAKLVGPSCSATGYLTGLKSNDSSYSTPCQNTPLKHETLIGTEIWKPSMKRGVSFEGRDGSLTR